MSSSLSGIINLLGRTMNILVGIVTDLGKDMLNNLLTSELKDQFDFLSGFKSNVEKLKSMREEIQKSVKSAEEMGEDVKDDVKNLLNEVDIIIENGYRLQGEGNSSPSYWTSIHKLSKEAMEKISNSAPIPTMESTPSRDFKIFESTELAMNKVKKALADENIHVIGVYGMGGVGKTSLVREIGKQVENEKLFDKVVMAVVSQDPDLRKVQGQIADMLGLKFEEASVMGRASKLSRRLEKVKSILVILDDIWAKLDMEELGIPFDGRNCRRGCKILLTTRRQDVCHAMKTQVSIPLNILSQQDAWDLFKRNVGIVVENDTFHDVGKEVVRECGGLPIAIVTVAGALRGKEDPQEWNDALHELRSSEPHNIEGLDLNVFSCLKWSYDYLRDAETQKLFLYCCLFPEDYDIYIEQMVRYGFGMGLFRNVATIEDARRKTHRIVKKLKSSSLLFEGSHGGCVKVHDIIRDVGISIASSGNYDEVFMVRARKGLKEWPIMDSTEQYTAISLMDNRIEKLPHQLMFSKLRTLLLQGVMGWDVEIPDTFFKWMEALRIMDLSYNGIFFCPWSIQCLTNLHTLILERCSELQDISVLGNLKELMILSLLGCQSIERLPTNMAQLANLRLLDLSYNPKLIIPPDVISAWSQLEELYMFLSFRDWKAQGVMDHGSKASLEE
ncbi:PREDICTED: disease resistance protein At4g27190-like [Nelumbo nucifera]|uniref:NB-ARC domain-containing protein n=2 Tax=Nelumbo nucifera TaxID=4432 RepID=A0A822ZBG1_NELNU|nr:PREDICTED: disease resistance protein At4g27190-like [Nelumbo nucifera]DAD43584.1 TPA_asm: hypothetical protein HUJ06_001814 [Nelumbo nucifera]